MPAAVDTILIYTCTVEQELTFVVKKWYIMTYNFVLCVFVCIEGLTGNLEGHSSNLEIS